MSTLETEDSYFNLLSFDLYATIQATLQAPSYHIYFEALLIFWILKLLFFTKSYKPKRHLTETEKEDLIKEWEPEPLVPSYPEDDPIINGFENCVVQSKIGKLVTVNGIECINLASFNFLGIVGRKDIEQEAINTISKYGVGSCGPRGFYGTVDVHLNLEEELQRFMGVEEAILYSYGFSTIASAIPAYSKRGDVIFADDGVSFSLQKGIQASRSKVYWFKHNDLEHLKTLLELQAAVDIKEPKKAKVTRRFLVCEGVYLNFGDICPLPKMVELKHKYKFRIFMDESVSFGTLGKTGRGVTEHYGVPISEVDLLCASLENSLGSIGGFACGRSYVVDHQRLSGQGYCFSASQPPFMAQAAIKALNIIETDNQLISNLQKNCKYMHSTLKKIKKIKLVGEPFSAVQHLQISCELTRQEKDIALGEIAKRCREQGVAVTKSAYLDEQEKTLPPPSIRIAVSNLLSTDDIDTAVSKLDTIIQDCLSFC
ncbi:DgyrCDS7197 [Dimorphilus gyrociliatus]|uniref:Serine palmitoyltransferase 1 n=1 Tax=Dimorphilus gyrociliatus TaxID=2664684 RepID=A0A7I8VS37_9ANNE|nr:DgyrCDS7197 [Dimorphilus gyrociliatus]